VYVTGYTNSTGWISGGYDPNYNGGTWTGDAFVMKLTAAGEHVWSTYLGGAGDENYFGVGDIAVDKSGNVYVTGSTNSPDWVSGGYDPNYNGGGESGQGDAFVVKLGADGTHLWSTYLGGAADDAGTSIAVDAAGDVYVSGIMNSPGWVDGGFDVTSNGPGFVARLTGSGDHVWSTCVRGTDVFVAVGPQGDVFVACTTDANDWASGGFDTTLDGLTDAAAIKLTNAGQHVWSTYLGGKGEDSARGIAVSPDGSVYVVGHGSGDWVRGGFDTTCDGVRDGVVVKLTGDGQHLWSAYLGGPGQDYTHDVTVNAWGDVYVTGDIVPDANSGPLPWVSGGFDVTTGGPGFLVKLTAQGNHLWSSYLKAIEMAVAVDARGNPHVAGTWHDVMLRASDVIVAKITDGGILPSPVYRFWSPDHRTHFYTIKESEKNWLLDRYPPNIWTLEGTVFQAYPPHLQPEGTVPVYRLWSPTYDVHFYTVTDAERDKLLAKAPAGTWVDEGIGFYAYPPDVQPEGTKPVYRFWSPANNAHFYTLDEAEKDKVSAPEFGWVFEGVAWNAYP
jgi:hypothetical protein